MDKVHGYLGGILAIECHGVTLMATFLIVITEHEKTTSASVL